MSKINGLTKKIDGENQFKGPFFVKTFFSSLNYQTNKAHHPIYGTYLQM